MSHQGTPSHVFHPPVRRRDHETGHDKPEASPNSSELVEPHPPTGPARMHGPNDTSGRTRDPPQPATLKINASAEIAQTTSERSNAAGVNVPQEAQHCPVTHGKGESDPPHFCSGSPAGRSSETTKSGDRPPGCTLCKRGRREGARERAADPLLLVRPGNFLA